MAENVTLAPVTSFTNDSSAVATVNANSTLIQNAFVNVLDRYGTAPNAMQAILDMNSFNIVNLPPPATLNSPVRLVDVITPSIALTVPTVGTSGSTVPLLNGNNTWTGTQNFAGAVTSVATQANTVNSTLAASTAFVQNMIKTLVIDIATYGGVGDGSTDNTTPLTNAMAALGTSGGIVYFGPGTYNFNSTITVALPATTKNITFSGAGIDATVLHWPSTNALTVTYGCVGSSFNLFNMSLTTAGAGTFNCITATFTGVEETFAGGFEAPSNFTNLMFRGNDGYPTTVPLTKGWANCATFTAISNVFFNNVTFQGPWGISTYSTTGTGVTVQGDFTTSNFGVVYNFTNCTFNSLNKGFVYGTWIQGVFFVNCNFTLCTMGINVPQDTHSSGLDQLSVSNSQFNCTTGIFVDATLNGGLISNNLFITPVGGICLQSGANGIPNGFEVVGNIFSGPGAGASTKLVQLGNATYWNIQGNNFVNCSGAGTFGINISSGCSNFRFEHNTFQNVTNVISNLGTTNIFIQNNLGYNPVGTSVAATAGTSPFTVTAGASPETHYINQSATNTATLTKGARSIGTLIGTSTYYTVELGPNESYVITWATTAPTYTRDIH